MPSAISLLAGPWRPSGRSPCAVSARRARQPRTARWFDMLISARLDDGRRLPRRLRSSGWKALRSGSACRWRRPCPLKACRGDHCDAVLPLQALLDDGRGPGGRGIAPGRRHDAAARGAAKPPYPAGDELIQPDGMVADLVDRIGCGPAGGCGDNGAEVGVLDQRVEVDALDEVHHEGGHIPIEGVIASRAQPADDHPYSMIILLGVLRRVAKPMGGWAGSRPPAAATWP